MEGALQGCRRAPTRPARSRELASHRQHIGGEHARRPTRRTAIASRPGGGLPTVQYASPRRAGARATRTRGGGVRTTRTRGGGVRASATRSSAHSTHNWWRGARVRRLDHHASGAVWHGLRGCAGGQHAAGHKRRCGRCPRAFVGRHARRLTCNVSANRRRRRWRGVDGCWAHVRGDLRQRSRRARAEPRRRPGWRVPCGSRRARLGRLGSWR